MDTSPKTEAREEDSTEDSSSNVGESDIFGNVHAGKEFYINKTVYDRLYDYQRKALLWFWELHQKGKGGILGDDMGLGKTIQVIAFLRGLMETKPLTKLKVLIVLPVTLLQNWEREFINWAPSISVYKLHGVSTKEREGLLNQVQRAGGVLLTSYGLVRSYWHELSRDQQEKTFVWDYMICDEGHKIKNPSAQTTKAAHAVKARHRFILTGTPIQNNLEEYWALFSFVDGSILGKRQTFKREYVLPITQARKKEATEETKAKGNALSDSLSKLTKPYLLRRQKDVLKKMGNEREWKDEDVPSCSYDWKIKTQPQGNEITSLAHKNDLVMWLSPSEMQIDFYNKYVNLDFFKQVMKENDKKCVFVELMILKKLCDHPRLLSKRDCRMLGLDLEPRFGEEDDPSELECAANDIAGVSEEVLLAESGKLQFLFKLLENLRKEGHRCLVFSRSLKMLNMIEKILGSRQFRWKRLDGTIRDLNEREAIIEDFQDDDSYHVFLLTTQVGGTGLNLTGADRVVIVDPSWNPSTDNQAVDRAYRIGQTRSVVVYRLITCGTIEEKIYRRQVFKESIIKQTMGNAEEDTYRYFTSQELRDLFVLEDTNISVTQRQLEELHAGQRRSERELDAHITFLQSIVSGISDHDLLFSLDGKTMRAKFKQYDAEVRMAESQLADDNKPTNGLHEHAMNEDMWKGCSTSDEKKWQLPSLHERHSLASQLVNRPTIHSQLMNEMFITDESSSEDDTDGVLSNLPKKFGVKKEEVSEALRQVQVTERQIVVKNATDPSYHVVKEEFPGPGRSTKDEKKPRLPTLHERQSLAKRRFGRTTRDSQTTNVVWTIDDSSSSEEDAGHFSNLPKTSSVKKEGTMKNTHQLKSESITDESRTLKEMDNVSGVCSNIGKVDIDSRDESLEMVEWRTSQEEDGSFHGDDAQHDDTSSERSSIGRLGESSDSSMRAGTESCESKNETFNGESSDTSMRAGTASCESKNETFNGESSDTSMRAGTASCKSENEKFKQEKEEESPKKRAKYQDYQFRWLDGI